MSTTRTPTRSLAAWLAGVALATAPTAGAQITVLSSTVQEHSATPGERYAGSIRVRNATGQAQSVRIYQTDYVFYADGTSHFDAAGSTPRSNARWITPSATQLVVAPGEEMAVTYTVAVPAADSLAGTYWSSVMVEGLPVQPTTSAASPGRTQVGVGAVLRYAVQVATHVSNGSRAVSFSDLRADARPNGARALELAVRNDGSQAYRPLLWLELYDESGALVARQQQERGLLYPGTSLRQRFELGRLTPGTYKVLLFADTGDASVYAVPYRLKL